MHLSATTNLTPSTTQSTPVAPSTSVGTSHKPHAGSHAAEAGGDGPAAVYASSTPAPSAGTYSSSGRITDADGCATPSAAHTAAPSGDVHGADCSGD